MADKELFGISEPLNCSDCVNHGGDWNCDHVHCRKGTDTISRRAALKGLEDLNIASFYEDNEHSKGAYMEVKAMLNVLPSATDTNVGGNLIDRQAAVEVADAVWTVTGDKNVAKVWQQLKDLPTVDAVPVVRCKDCKHHYYDKSNIPYCSEGDYAYGWKDDDFCSYGEQKDGDHAEGAL